MLGSYEPTISDASNGNWGELTLHFLLIAEVTGR